MKVDTNLWGVVLILDHNEVGTLKVNTAAITGTITGVGAGSLTTSCAGSRGRICPIVTVVVAGVAAAIAVNLALIQEVDKGNGTYITIPWPAIFAAAPVLIPTTAPAATPPPAPDWAGGANGAFGTTDQADRISFSIEHNVAPFTLVTFKLAIAPSSSGTSKSIQLPDNRVIQSTRLGHNRRGGCQFHFCTRAIPKHGSCFPNQASGEYITLFFNWED